MLAALALTGCAGSAASNRLQKPTLVAPDSALTQQCKRPSNLPDRDLKQVEVERYWTQDRMNLVQCGKRHDGLKKFYDTRDQALRGESK